MALTQEDPDLALAELAGDRVVVLHGRHAGELQAGRDVDCLVEGLDPRWPLRLTGGWRLCQWHRYDLRAWYWVLERDGEFVALDTTDDPEGFGRDAVRTRSILSEMDGEPSELTRVAYLTVKRVRKGTLDPEEWARIGKVASGDQAGFAAALERLAGPELASLLTPIALAGVAPEPAVVRRANRLRWMRRFGTARRTARALEMGMRRYAERILSPSGLSVLVVGPDGAGKSTLAASLPQECAPMFRRHAHSHWRPGILPRPGALLGRGPSDPTRPHARAAFGRLPSALLLGYYWVDFLAGALFRDLPLKARSGLIVRERGWWDLVVDPQRYRMRVEPAMVRMLGAFLPRPDIVIALEADPDLIRDRKPEIERPELERQLAAWRSASLGGVPVARIDVSRSPEDVLRLAGEAVVRVMESRALSRLDAGWATLPGRRIRWWLPRGPRAVARASVSVYQPATGRARLGWTVARGVGSGGGFRLLPRGSPPPEAVRRALAPHVPRRGTVAVGRANHPHRFIALLLREDGSCRAVAKVATDGVGAQALEAEAAALGRFGETVPRPLFAPRVLDAEPGLLLLEPVEWIRRPRPWVLETDVARALGGLFRAGRRPAGGGWMGPSHGDCAPWNLLRTSSGWALVDWESAGEAPPFHDVCHHVVQSHALLGRPFASEVIAGFVRGEGWVGRAVRAYAEAADLSDDDASDFLARYLRKAIHDRSARTAAERTGNARRRRLLARLVG
jgi:hypothetical protein